MKAFDVRIDGKLKDIIVCDTLEQAIEAITYAAEIKENEYSKGKDIIYSDECQMYMIQISEGGTYYPLYSTLNGREPLTINGEKIKRDKSLRKATCNLLHDDMYWR